MARVTWVQRLRVWGKWLSVAALWGCTPGTPTGTVAEPICFELPGSETDAAPKITKGKTNQGNTHQGTKYQGKTGQGSTEQGTRYQGSKYQGKTGQGNTHQSNASQGSEAVQALDPEAAAREAAETERRALLHALNGVSLSTLDGDPVRFDRGRLLDADAASIVGALRASNRAGDLIEIEVEALEPTSEAGGAPAYAVSSQGRPLCLEGEHGVFVRGAWADDGSFLDAAGTFTFACDSGVIAKCVHWGYTPWQAGELLHQTCTRMARADYCGDGASWTREGTLVNIYDRLDIQRSEPSSELSFEAAWGPDGAVCVDLPRYQISGPEGEPLLPPCWVSLPRCKAQDFSVSFPLALMANDAAHEELSACAAP